MSQRRIAYAILNIFHRAPVSTILIFALLFHWKMAYAIVQDRPYDEAVSLGYSCQVAQQLNDNGIRHQAYPFDWMLSSAEGLILFIHYAGAGFLDLDKIAIEERVAGTNILIVADTLYGFRLLHDFYDPFDTFYPIVKQKYERRIARFFNLLRSNKKVLFVRIQFTREQAELLDFILHTLYPQLTYTILALNPEPQADWGLERVKNLQLHQIPDVWYGDHTRWREILSQFNVKPSPNPPQLPTGE
ncbi:DUF1796 family putative cysteine peptidase [Candidatus Protochlamydia phocaeensis]|uniref:DUF1796 family putative cysteine peptidase n=1 Tax=Candidatus Protochlamydia phocaeensis TaxID=1414722 RepID=UPI000837F5C8|nr:DUF1796 family putative cysteine peptidase [Candidatus Protochlamydia phocaeensis]